MPIRRAVDQKQSTQNIRFLGTAPARRDVKDTVQHLLRGMGGGAASVNSSYDLIEGGTLAHVERLIDHHWSEMSHVFRQPHIRAPLTSSTFRDQFKVVRLARNDAYHHRTVSSRPRLVSIMEQLLDLLDISISARLNYVGLAKIKPLQFSIAIEPRHS